MSTHNPQPEHRASFIQAIVPSPSTNGFDNIVQALAAAPHACDMLSSTNFGECANPHRKIPSVANSTGLSFMCASKKKPSLLSGTFSIFARSSFPFGGKVAALRTKRSGSTTNSSFNTRSGKVTFKAPASFSTLGLFSSSYLTNITPFSLASL